MRTLILAAATASALALSACSAADTASVATGADMTPEQRDAYVQMAAASDLFEIQSSQIAVDKAQRAEIRSYAQMLIQHHTQTTQQLTAAAQTAGANPPAPALLPMQREMIERLQSASAANFDKLYISQQVPAHEMALALHRNYANDGDSPPLRTVAAAAVPIVTQHLEQARQLNR
jgi:putative membrane protein